MFVYSSKLDTKDTNLHSECPQDSSYRHRHIQPCLYSIHDLIAVFQQFCYSSNISFEPLQLCRSLCCLLRVVVGASPKRASGDTSSEWSSEPKLSNY
jgi:hypothetical protein